MKLTPTLLTLAIGAHSGLQAAQTWEIDAGAAFGEWGDFDITSWHAGTDYYLDPLVLSGPEPLAEAAFVERPRTLHATLQRSTTTLDVPSWYLDDARTTAEIAYEHRSPRSPHAFSFGYGFTDAETRVRQLDVPEPAPVSRTSGYAHALRAGYVHYLQPRLSLGVHGTYEYETSKSSGTGRDIDEYDLAARLRYLQALGGKTWLALAVAAGRTESRSTFRFDNWPDEHTSYDFAHLDASVDFYFSRFTRLGVSWSTETFADIDTVGVQLEHYVTERVALSIAAQRAIDDAGPDTDLLAVGVSSRI